MNNLNEQIIRAKELMGINILNEQKKVEGLEHYKETGEISESELERLKEISLETAKEEVVGKTLNLYMDDRVIEDYNDKLERDLDMFDNTDFTEGSAMRVIPTDNGVIGTVTVKDVTFDSPSNISVFSRFKNYFANIISTNYVE